MMFGETIEEKSKKLKVENWEELTPKNILIYGDSKVGKTYSALGLVKREMIKDKEVNLYVVNTDMGFAEPAKNIGMIEFKSRINYYYVTEISDAIKLIEELQGKIKPKDYLIWDLTSWIWEQAQQEYMNVIAGNSKISFIINSGKDPKKFGLYSANQWQTIKKIDAQVTNFLTRNLKCNVIGITGVKDTEIEDILSKKTQGIYSKVGRPEGRKDLLYEFSTIIRILRDDESFKRSFIITGTRAINLKDYKPIDYDEPSEMWEHIEKLGVI